MKSVLLLLLPLLPLLLLLLDLTAESDRLVGLVSQSGSSAVYAVAAEVSLFILGNTKLIPPLFPLRGGVPTLPSDDDAMPIMEMFFINPRPVCCTEYFGDSQPVSVAGAPTAVSPSQSFFVEVSASSTLLVCHNDAAGEALPL